MTCFPYALILRKWPFLLKYNLKRTKLFLMREIKFSMFWDLRIIILAASPQWASLQKNGAVSCEQTSDWLVFPVNFFHSNHSHIPIVTIFFLKAVICSRNSLSIDSYISFVNGQWQLSTRETICYLIDSFIDFNIWDKFRFLVMELDDPVFIST